MKRWIFAVTALLIAVGAEAQELRKPKQPGTPQGRQEIELLDTLAAMSLWKPDFKSMQPMQVEPVVSMSSVVAISHKYLPARIAVIDNNTLRIGAHFNLSNGQGWNWGPFPNSFLDARTLSFPMP